MPRPKGSGFSTVLLRSRLRKADQHRREGGYELAIGRRLIQAIGSPEEVSLWSVHGGDHLVIQPNPVGGGYRRRVQGYRQNVRPRLNVGAKLARLLQLEPGIEYPAEVFEGVIVVHLKGEMEKGGL